MTNNELERLAALIADELVERLRNDRELQDKLYPSKNYDVEGAANYLKIPTGTLRHLTHEISHAVIGRRLVFKERDLAEYVQNMKIKL